MTERLTPATGLAALARAGKEFTLLFRHGTLEVEIYKPNKFDPQMPHARDEVYVVISGSGTFFNGGVRQPFEAGEVLFVPAGVEHRFEDFTDDFATWVFFYGPQGGEKSGA
jgi:mannose-6-phosphate isomerase-like protein (cupin superfamily)